MFSVNKEQIMKTKKPKNSVYHDPEYGVIFGAGEGARESYCDICINDNCNEFVSSSSNLG